jgi:hypothetical protein
MIELITQCGIGLLIGYVLTLAFFPFARRRAARSAQRELTAAAPLATTTTEIQAEKDQMRAEFVQSIRRLEVGVEQIREKALARLGPADKRTAEMKRLQSELDQKAAQIVTLRAQAEWHKTVARRILKPLLYIFARTRRRQKPAVVTPPMFKFEQGPQWEFKKQPVQNGSAFAGAPVAANARAQTDLAVVPPLAAKAHAVKNDLSAVAPATPANVQPELRDIATVATPLAPKAKPADSDLAATAAAIAAVNLKRRRAISNKI